MLLPPELVSLVCAHLPKATLATVLRCSSASYALAAPHLYATLCITRANFPSLMARITLRSRGKVGWDLVPLSGPQIFPLVCDAPTLNLTSEREGHEESGELNTQWFSYAPRRRKLALLAHCTELVVEDYPDLECFGAICVLAWRGETPSEQRERMLFPNVRSVRVAGLAEPCLPGGMALSGSGLAHPLLGLVTEMPLEHAVVQAGSREEVVLCAACIGLMTIVLEPCLMGRSPCRQDAGTCTTYY